MSPERNEPDRQLPWPVVHRYLAGESTPAEEAAVHAWAQHQGLEPVDLPVLRKALRELPSPPVEPNVDVMWGRVRQRSVATSPDARQGRRRSWSWGPLVAAASLVMALAIGIHFWSGHAVVYTTAAGQRTSVRLPDGTNVVLGPESRLQVASSYGRHSRMLSLRGEAFFSVVHDAAHPFAVRTARVVVQDVGTEFTVRAYDGDGEEQVAVAAGAVDLHTSDRLHPASSRLGPGDWGRVADNGVSVIHQANIDALMAWTQGRLAFDNIPLKQVIRELGRTFDLKVTLADSALGEKLVTGNFAGQSADDILWEVSAAIGARYEREGRRVVIRAAPSKVRTPAHAAPPPARVQTLAQDTPQ